MIPCPCSPVVRVSLIHRAREGRRPHYTGEGNGTCVSLCVYSRVRVSLRALLCILLCAQGAQSVEVWVEKRRDSLDGASSSSSKGSDDSDDDDSDDSGDASDSGDDARSRPSKLSIPSRRSPGLPSTGRKSPASPSNRSKSGAPTSGRKSPGPPSSPGRKSPGPPSSPGRKGPGSKVSKQSIGGLSGRSGGLASVIAQSVASSGGSGSVTASEVVKAAMKVPTRAQIEVTVPQGPMLFPTCLSVLIYTGRMLCMLARHGFCTEFAVKSSVQVCSRRSTRSFSCLCVCVTMATTLCVHA